MVMGGPPPVAPPWPPPYSVHPPKPDSSYVVAALAVAIAIVFVGSSWFYLVYSPETGTPNCCPQPLFAISSATEEPSFNQTGTMYTPYGFSIQSASSGLTAIDFTFELLSANGTARPFAYVGLIDVSNCWIGTYTASWESGVPSASPPGAQPCGSTGPTLADQILSGDQILLVTAISISGQGYTLVLLNQGGFQGSVSAAIP